MYSFREIVFDNGEKEFAIDFHDKNKEILSVFLFAESDDLQDRIINIIDKVINNESSYEKFVGNVCRVEVSPHTTKISDIFDMNTPCEIETKELRNLIDIWLKKLDEFNKTGEV